MKKTTTRKIPATMATQHPDHAGKPYWHTESFIPAVAEARECFLCFSDLGISEYKWDWEGKLVDEAVLERLLGEQYQYFKKRPIGKEKFLTFRLPNPKVETEFRMSRALMGILSAAGLAKQVGLHSPPLFEVILPMTESAEEMIDIQEAFREIAGLKHPLNKFEKEILSHIQIIPLFESVDTIIRSDKILEKYLNLHKKKFGFTPEYIRPYVARSDPALNSGIVPTILAIKIALSHYKDFEKKHNIKLYPVVGVGTLPFRGSLNPLCPQDFIAEYQGIRTAIVQSAFRYDFPLPQVKKAIKLLELNLPKGQAQNVSKEEEKELADIIKHFEKPYQETIEKLAPIINRVAGFLPKRRERVQHIGLFGYSRGIGKVKLPRAISFTAALYSLGVPPELIGTGRGIAYAKKYGKIHLAEKYYVSLKKDLCKAGRFLYRQGLIELAQKSAAFKGALKDVEEIENYLGKPLGPQTFDELEHNILSARIHQNLSGNKNLTPYIEQSAILRHSMG
ncbi:MAG: phosphoenolpyruvate carboxylase [Patescibacteria group bacterium]|nr:phosphoenolpyruvate carboxylase [Patescibacteria group bacterium]